MYFSEYTDILRHENKVILANNENGMWMRISEEVFGILQEFIRLSLKVRDIEEIFEDKNDADFFMTVITQLVQMEIILEAADTVKEKHKFISYEMTNQCNLRCSHCCVDAGESTGELVLDTDGSKNVLQKMAEWNPRSILLSGGEPMVRSDFFELVTHLRNIYDGNIILSTNATLISSQNVDFLSRMINQFEISLDGIDEQTCAQIRGKGVFSKVINSIKLLKKHGVQKINLSMVISDKNENLKEDFEKLNRELGTTPLFRQFSAVGRGKINRKQFTDIDEDDVYIPSDYLSKEYHKTQQICHCGAGKREIHIKSNGDVYPCVSYTGSKYKLGNLCMAEKIADLTKNMFSIEQIYESERIKEANLDCKNCLVNIFCWTCPSVFYEITTIKALKKNCEYIKPLLIQRVWGEKV